MKTQLLLPTILFIAFATANTFGQTVTIGTGISSNTISGYPAPYGNWDNGARTKLEYKGSEITAAGGIAGNITALAFDVSSVNACPLLMNYSISIGTTWTGGTTTVFSNNYQPVIGWNTHQFTSPFYWDGSSNIVVEICFENSTYTENASTRWTTGFTNFPSGSHNWTTGGSCTSILTLYNQRPNVRFTMATSSGMNEIKDVLIISVFPNPFSPKTVLHTDKIFKNATLTVYNLYGQTVKQIDNLSGQTIIFHRDNLLNGLYFIRLTQDSKVISADKLVITD